ncbi:hypothetical protein CWI38_0161p0030 [Hamiltosporidium tvaerminnensis]|uniref:Uncharacterized protein n=1 Tax=Hamiltosporidium tvaerminnensis TaxID=1176355 RepID=A0A4Q9M2R4_9MICR|nr:hypothetical protein CWI38_0161p0030 [Hamiltosporidium tvaerminnensis]
MMCSFVFYILHCSVLCTTNHNINTTANAYVNSNVNVNDMYKLEKFISLRDNSVYQSFFDINTVPNNINDQIEEYGNQFN